jgi:5-methylcytosine-specific restriction protein B
MAKLPSVPEATYGALERIRRVVLVDFSSLFSPERAIWTGPNLETLHELFVHRFDKGEGDFFAKFREQLEGADDDGLQLAAELLYVQQFFTSLTGPEKKLQNVRRVLGWMSRAVELPRWAVDGVALGLSGDQSFNQHRPYHLAWLIEFLLAWHAEVDRAAILDDPGPFRSFAMSVEGTQGAHQPMREVWFHLIMTDILDQMSSLVDYLAFMSYF